MPAPICAKCKLVMKMSKLGQGLLFTRKTTREGRVSREPQIPYKAHMGDAFICPGCAAQVVVYNPSPFWHESDGLAALANKNLITVAE